MAQLVKNLPLMREMQVWSLSWKDPLEEGMTTHSSILGWRVPWTEEPDGLQSMGSQRVWHNWAHAKAYSWREEGGERKCWGWLFCLEFHLSLKLSAKIPRVLPGSVSLGPLAVEQQPSERALEMWCPGAINTAWPFQTEKARRGKEITRERKHW